MIKFFRRIRKRLLAENKFSKYLLYAIGEIVLVVVGILIALQVNNWNIERIDQKMEAKYLGNIKLDLEKDLSLLEYLIEFRQGRLLGDRKLITQIEGDPVDDLNELTFNVVNSLMEERFTPNNNTYSELSSSGNLNLLSNDSIKILLLELEALYNTNQFGITHEAFDYQEYLSKPLAQCTDLSLLIPVFMGKSTVEEQGITQEDFTTLFQRTEYKNGLYILTMMSEAFIADYAKIQAKSQEIIDHIETDLNRINQQ